MGNAIILAAGKGTRMVSEHAKVMQKVLGEPMIGHVCDHLEEAGIDRIVTVIGYKGEEVREYLGNRSSYALQEPQLGTGHAVMMAEELKNETGKTLIVSGDCPLISAETYKEFLKASEEADLCVLTMVPEDPKAYGRIVRDENGAFLRITEYKDCNEEEKKIREVNAGIYCVENSLLWEYLKEIKNENAQKEYYVTDLVGIFLAHGKKVSAYAAKDAGEMMGINDRKALAEANEWLKRKINAKWTAKGVTIYDPAHTYISKDAKIGKDTEIYPNTTLEGNVTIGENCVITSGTYLRDTTIGDRCTIDASEITDSEIAEETTVGPHSHLRNGCKIGAKCRIGNYVELKNTTFGYNTKCAHLTYVGDAVVGSKVNFGCGVVTVNYDGKHKYRTVIEDGAFIGSNVNLIAPVHIGKNALLAAGSTITEDVPDGDMGIARVRQSNKEGYGSKYLKK